MAHAVVTDAARAEVLRLVREALSDVPADERPSSVEAAAQPSPLAPGSASTTTFVERVEDYRASVTLSSRAKIGEAVEGICARHDARRLAVAAGVCADWLPRTVELVRDEPPLAIAALDELDGVLTGSALAIAETGTIVLDGGPASGRRALSLIPDLHICVVRAADVVAGVAEAITRMAPLAAAGQPVTLVSGPSATSDIELDRVEGVHGPRRLEVILVEG